MKKANLSEQTMISIIWTSLMSCVEWNKKEELVTEQAIKHLKVFYFIEGSLLRDPLFVERVRSDGSEPNFARCVSQRSSSS